MTTREGVDHTVYKDEVEQRWGTKAYASGDRWWRALGAEGQAAFKAEAAAIEAGLRDARASGTLVSHHAVQGLIARHYAWVTQGWGGTAPSADAFRGLGEMYVADPRFAQAYGGVEGAEYVRDAIGVYADAELA